MCGDPDPQKKFEGPDISIQSARNQSLIAAISYDS